MGRIAKFVIAGILLIVVGILVFMIPMVMSGFDPEKMDTAEYVTNTYDVADSFHNIRIDSDIEQIRFIPSEDGACRVVCDEKKDDPYDVRVEGETLIIDRQAGMFNFEIMSISTAAPKICVYLPEQSYGTLSIVGATGDVEIPNTFNFHSISAEMDTGAVNCLASVSGDLSVTTDTGEINVSAISASEMKLKSDTGEIKVSDVQLEGSVNISEGTGDTVMENVSCRRLEFEGDTGLLSMKNVLAADDYKLETVTGDIEFEACDAGEIRVKTDTGSVTGTLLSDKVYLIETDTGKIDVPKTISGGRCEIETSTGDVSIEVEERE